MEETSIADRVLAANNLLDLNEPRSNLIGEMEIDQPADEMEVND